MTLQFQPERHGLPMPDLSAAAAPGSGLSYDGRRSIPARAAQGRYAGTFKRLGDLILASIALVLVMPLLILLTVALWVEGGKPIYFQRRLGRDGKVFRMWKLRSMVVDADRMLQDCLDTDPALRAEWNRTQKLKRDPRITPLGRLLRITSLDELPQLINVIKGDMSLVGPRPMLPEQLPLYLHPEAYLALRPGITGLWQVTARNEAAFALRAELDRDYYETLSCRGDLRILGATFGAVINSTGY